MRQTYKADFMHDPSGLTVGVRLGDGGCTEHEIGIPELYSMFGAGVGPVRPAGILSRLKAAPAPLLGVAKRTVTSVPAGVTLAELPGVDYSVLYFLGRAGGSGADEEVRSVLRGIGVFCRGSGTIRSSQIDLPDVAVKAGWDDGSFGIGCRGEAARKDLRELHEAFLCKGICFGFPCDVEGWPRGGGLTFLIASRIPQVVRDAVLAADRDKADLKAAADATGIAAVLKQAGKEYFALSPRWTDESRTGVSFWLNPVDQGSCNAGTFTVDELRRWAEGGGPVLKASAPQASARRR